MGLLIVLFVVVFGFGIPFLLSDSGSRPSDRLSDGYGVPRQWFDADAVNRYARFGRSVRYLGLGLGGILGWGIARVSPVGESASLYRCEPAAGLPSVIIREPFAPRSSDPVVGRLPVPLGVRVWRNATKERSIDRPYAALYPRSIQDYVPGKLGLGWIAALAIFCAVVAGNGTQYHLNDPTQWFSSPAEYWIVAASLLAGAICVVAGSIGVVRSSAAFDANDARALIVDDARRACAVQRLIGASMLLLMSAVTRFSENGHLGILALPSTIFSFWGAVVWCSPAGIPPKTAERWKSLFSVEQTHVAPRETAAVERAMSRELGEGSGVSR
jgi:hypothetical protein